MSEDILRAAMYEGISIDLVFEGYDANLDDLILIQDEWRASFEDDDAFADLETLDFDQADDFWAFYEDIGDVVVWLYPLVDGAEVYHHTGPYTGFRLAYDILGNPIRAIDRFLLIITWFAREFPVKVTYPLRSLVLGNPPNLTILATDIQQVVEYWRSKGIEPGSTAARQMHR
jgi:hypothetical protein